ncbi:MAG: hypothetical protein P8Z00_19730 [Anaerolineales bacterium]
MNKPVEIFTIRIWREKLDERQSEWRGKVQHLSSGQSRYFNEIGKVAEFISDHLSKSKGETHAAANISPGKFGPRIHYPLKHRQRRRRGRLEKRLAPALSSDFHSAGSYSSKPYIKEGGDKRLLRRFVHWIKRRLFVKSGMRPLKKSLVLLVAILMFVGDWVQVSWLGPRLHSIVFRPKNLFRHRRRSKN